MSTMNRCPAALVAGRPPEGGRPTGVSSRQGCHAMLVASAPEGAAPNCLCTVEVAHAKVAAGCPSFGGQRAPCAPPRGNRRTRSPRRSVWQHLKRSSNAVHTRQVIPLGCQTAEYGLPNPAFEPTAHGKPWSAAQRER